MMEPSPPANDDDPDEGRFMASLGEMSHSERARTVSLLSHADRAELAPKRWGMRGLSTGHSRWTRCKHLLSALFNTANAAVGSGILAFPYAFSVAGWGLALLISCCAGAVNCYSLTVVLRCARKHNTWSYQAIVAKLYGRRAEQLLQWARCSEAPLPSSPWPYAWQRPRLAGSRTPSVAVAPAGWSAGSSRAPLAVRQRPSHTHPPL